MTELEFRRRSLGLSQSALGQRILYSKAMVSNMEKNSPSPNTVHPRLRAALENFFEVPLEQLLAQVTSALPTDKRSTEPMGRARRVRTRATQD